MQKKETHLKIKILGFTSKIFDQDDHFKVFLAWLVVLRTPPEWP